MKSQRRHVRRLGLMVALIGSMSVATVLLMPTALAQAPVATSSWTSTGNLNTARAGHNAILLPDGKVLVLGGAARTRAELYDPSTGTWSFTGSHNIGGCATLLLTGKVLIAGGGSAELYDPVTGTLTVTGNMTEEASCGSATLLTSGKVLITGSTGKSVNGYPAAATPELYDPSTGTFTSTGRFVGQGVDSGDIGLLSPAVTLLQNGKVLFATSPTAQLYDPVSGTFSLTGAMIIQVSDFPRTATLLRNGKVLLTGGETESRLRNAELYDPSTGTFTATGDMTSSRVFHTATLLPDGRVLITGGESDGCAVGRCTFAGSVASAEIFDPSTGTFSSVADMAARRELHTATLLNDGRVLIAGGLWYAGIGQFEGMLASAELYTPGASLPLPRIISASVSGKKLIVVGEDFDSGAVILIDGNEQRTRNDDQNPQTTLIGKKAGKKIQPGDHLQVRNPNGALSEEFTFTVP